MAGPPSDDELARTATAAGAPAAAAERPSGAKLEGTLGRYRLEKMLGEGGMGAVYAAFDPDLERRVALKVLRDAKSGDEARQRLLREARAMARLTHPNVVTVHEVGSASGRDYVAMELVDGDTLADWLRGDKRGEDDVLDAFRAAGRGLAAAHAAGLVHRDFKPHNVLRRRDGRVAVTDFGLARGVEAAASGLEATVDLGPASSASNTPSALSGLTATGSVLGTPAYMAPEQWAGETVGPPADQFAYCVALWEALTGQRPFGGATLDELKRQVARGAADLDTAKLPRPLRAPLVRGLDPDPAKRWPSMDALVAAITRAERRPKVALFVLAGAVVASAALYVALGRGGAPAAAACPAPALAPDQVWSSADASAFTAAGRGEIGELFGKDAAAWRTLREQACALAPERRAPALACLDGALARLQAVRRGLEKVAGDVPPDAVAALLFEPAACSQSPAPRLALKPTPDTIAALAAMIEATSDRKDLKPDAAAALAAKPGIDPCARAYALHAELAIEDDWGRSKPIASDAVSAADACGDERVRAEILMAVAPFDFEAPTIGPKGRAALEKAKIAIDRVGQHDLQAKLELQLSRIAGQDKRWDEAFAAVKHATDAFGARGMLRAQIGAEMHAAELYFSRNEGDDLEQVKRISDRVRPVALAHHFTSLVEDIDGTLAYGHLFSGDIAAAHSELIRLYHPTPTPTVPSQAIDGIVVDDAGHPVAGATVASGQLVWVDSIGPVPFGQAEATGYRATTSDAAGKFEFKDAAMSGSVVAQSGTKLAAVALAPHVRLVLAATRAVSGKVDLASTSRTKLFVLAVPFDHLGFGVMSPLAKDGSYSLGMVPTTAMSIGVATWGIGFASDTKFEKLPAGTAPISTMVLHPSTGERTLAVVARSEVATPFDIAQVFVFPGHHELKIVADLEKIPDRSSLQMRFGKPLVGEAIPKDARDKVRPGDLVAEFTGVRQGEVTACVIGIHGDIKEATLQRQLEVHRRELQMKCMPVGANDAAVVVEAPAQKRFD